MKRELIAIILMLILLLVAIVILVLQNQKYKALQKAYSQTQKTKANAIGDTAGDLIGNILSLFIK